MHEQKSTWVVFTKTIHKMGAFPAVCPQREWEALERARPGYHQLVRADLPSEAEAEKFARMVQSVRTRPLAAPGPRWR